MILYFLYPLLPFPFLLFPFLSSPSLLLIRKLVPRKDDFALESCWAAGATGPPQPKNIPSTGQVGDCAGSWLYGAWTFPLRVSRQPRPPLLATPATCAWSYGPTGEQRLVPRRQKSRPPPQLVCFVCWLKNGTRWRALGRARYIFSIAVRGHSAASGDGLD